MSSYSELIKNMENIRSYMRQFYVYGLKGRTEYTEKSSRSYDNERRRLESWLGEYMEYISTNDGKKVYLSINSRELAHNPLFKAWKAKSFTDGDITLHFLILDILNSHEEGFSLSEITEKLYNDYLSHFDVPIEFDESTIRKKLNEYCDLGILRSEKSGKKALYYRNDSPMITGTEDVLNFFSEVAPCGVIGSFILDRMTEIKDVFSYKHHYLTASIDSDVLANIFCAMRQKSSISIINSNRKRSEPQMRVVVPLRIFISVQNGRQYLLAYQPEYENIGAYRVDYISDVEIKDYEPKYDDYRATLNKMQSKMWGVSISQGITYEKAEHVEFTVFIDGDEDYVLQRLKREKRVGVIERQDDNTYKFSADLYDSSEIVPWIRTFLCRITSLEFSNKRIEKQIRQDVEAMYEIYNIKEDE